MSYEKMAQKIKESLAGDLGISFSVGLAPTKVLAKLASKWKKPSGLTIISGPNIHLYLKDLQVEKVWGIGSQTSAYLNKLGVRTALEFVNKDAVWVKNHLTKPHYEIWQELKGISVHNVDNSKKTSYQSISKTKTFTPPSKEKDFVFSQLSKNVENACIKARRYNLCAKKFFCFLKTQDFKYYGLEFKLNRFSNVPNDFLELINKDFNEIFKKYLLYRASGFCLLDLAHKQSSQLDIFGQVERSEKYFQVFSSLDDLASRYGKHTLFLGTSLRAVTNQQHNGNRGQIANRKLELFRGETKRKRLAIPTMGEV
jgi:DNA polymerase-4/DNA polymerase V